MTLFPRLVLAMHEPDLQLDELKSQLQTVPSSKNISFLHELHELLKPFSNISIEYQHMDHTVTVVGPEFKTLSVSRPFNITTTITQENMVTLTEIVTKTIIETQTIVETVTVTTTEDENSTKDDKIKFTTKTNQPYDFTTSLAVAEVAILTEDVHTHTLNETTIRPTYPLHVRENVLHLGPKLVVTTMVYSNFPQNPSQSTPPLSAKISSTQATTTFQKTVVVKKVNEYDLLQNDEILHVDIEFHTSSPATTDFTSWETSLQEYQTTQFDQTLASNRTIYNSTKSRFDYSKFMNDSHPRKPTPPSNMIQRNSSGHSKELLANLTMAVVVFSLIWFYISV